MRNWLTKNIHRTRTIFIKTLPRKLAKILEIYFQCEKLTNGDHLQRTNAIQESIKAKNIFEITQSRNGGKRKTVLFPNLIDFLDSKPAECREEIVAKHLPQEIVEKKTILTTL